MKVSDFLKKIATISGAEIQIEFQENKSDTEPDVARLNEYTTEETADQIIELSAQYTLQEVEFAENTVIITATRTARRTPKQKTEKQQDAVREEQKQAIADELERLDQAVAVLTETIVAPFRLSGKQAEKKRGGIAAVLHNARAAVRRILNRLFRKGRNNEQ